jgi:CHASE3 domain sensor protein
MKQIPFLVYLLLIVLFFISLCRYNQKYQNKIKRINRIKKIDELGNYINQQMQKHQYEKTRL